MDGDEFNEDLLLDNKCFQELETQKNFAQDNPQEELVIQDIQQVINALLTNFESLDGETRRKIRQYENEINTSKVGWMRLSVETNLNILTSLLFEWLENLKIPILKLEHFENIVVLFKQPEECFQKFGMEESYLIEYILKFLSKLQPISAESLQDILKRFIASLSKHTVNINSTTVPSGEL